MIIYCHDQCNEQNPAVGTVPGTYAYCTKYYRQLRVKPFARVLRSHSIRQRWTRAKRRQTLPSGPPHSLAVLNSTTCTNQTKQKRDNMKFTPSSRDWATSVLSATPLALEQELRAPWDRLAAALAEIQQPSAHEYMCAHGHVKYALDNVTRSRYSNILPFDHGVVRVSRGGYINASWIRFADLSSAVSPFIIAQGPMHPRFYGEDTTGSFWEMVFEHRAKAVVNLARCETGFGGCARYWPLHENSETYGESIIVTVKSCEELEPGLWRRLISLRRNGMSDAAGRGHDLEHFHFENWPNYEIATDASTTATLLRRVVQLSVEAEPDGGGGGRDHSENSARPIVVHCSGGVGRSGTFVAAAATLLLCGGFSKQQQQDNWSSTRFAGLIAVMRKQRHPWMVEGFEQFAFGARLASSVILRFSSSGLEERAGVAQAKK